MIKSLKSLKRIGNSKEPSIGQMERIVGNLKLVFPKEDCSVSTRVSSYSEVEYYIYCSKHNPTHLYFKTWPLLIKAYRELLPPHPGIFWNSLDVRVAARRLGFENPNEAIVHLYEKRRWACQPIGAALGLTESAIRARLPRLGVTLRKKGGSE